MLKIYTTKWNDNEWCYSIHTVSHIQIKVNKYILKTAMCLCSKTSICCISVHFYILHLKKFLHASLWYLFTHSSDFTRMQTFGTYQGHPRHFLSCLTIDSMYISLQGKIKKGWGEVEGLLWNWWTINWKELTMILVSLV